MITNIANKQFKTQVKNVESILFKSKSKVEFVEDEFETIVSLVTTMDTDRENMIVSVESYL